MARPRHGENLGDIMARRNRRHVVAVRSGMAILAKAAAASYSNGK